MTFLKWLWAACRGKWTVVDLGLFVIALLYLLLLALGTVVIIHLRNKL